MAAAVIMVMSKSCGVIMLVHHSTKGSGHDNVVSIGDLIKMDDYCAITFPNTHSALQAEKTLQEAGNVPFVIMPLPRIISSSCGLSVKIAPDSLEETVAIMKNSGTVIEGAYRIDKNRNTADRLI